MNSTIPKDIVIPSDIVKGSFLAPFMFAIVPVSQGGSAVVLFPTPSASVGDSSSTIGGRAGDDPGNAVTGIELPCSSTHFVELAKLQVPSATSNIKSSPQLWNLSA